jgi:FdrA protein
MEMDNPVEFLFSEPLVVINLGLKGFAESLEVQDVDVIHVDWTPPAGGDQEMIDILDGLL